MNVQLVNVMGSDLMVVNAARVSFAKESTLEWVPSDDSHQEEGEYVLSEKDARLIRYLAKHGHWTPFGHPQVTFRVRSPIFVARQLMRHTVGLVVNEVSRRYVDDPPEFFRPHWGQRVSNMKQGRGGPLSPATSEVANFYWRAITSQMELCYRKLLELNVAPEQARAVLPLCMYTEWYWTGSLAAWGRVCRLRLDAHAQGETREIAEMISKEMVELFPVSWEALLGAAAS